ncbi:dihydrofolate reductase family protein [Microbispora sp. ATCC PTA-5024]|uniref:dihydrofolate reductase family protein n=1 Tax=Microbispora sp. ATCC PTA-5024 TaxID=316330 RepID=UPI0003DBFED6|nr:dihydrofolate reductase family protein [Microbispora sp. ATCC PTA-5024]ETK37867.1 deaminase [Microbispora sp. ATCC PTA-5024]
MPLDGYIAAPDGSFGFFPFEGEIQSAILAEYPETMPVHARGPLGLDGVSNRCFDTVLMGRATYEPALSVGVTSPYAHLRQYVFSRTLSQADPAVPVVAEDPVSFVQRLKKEDGAGIWLCGGGKLAAALLPEIDRLVVKRHPLVIGSGVPLFDRPFGPVRFAPDGTRAFAGGESIETYRRV